MHALVLNAAGSWAAYQVGALGHLVRERQVRFDAYAGTGLGALNAAMAACGQLDALERFWKTLSWRDLFRPSIGALRRGGVLRPTPFERLLADHVSEHALVERGATLTVTTIDVATGAPTVMRFPGHADDVAAGVIAALSTPGLFPPVDRFGGRLVDGTVVDSAPITSVLSDEVTDVTAVFATLVARDAGEYPTWRAAMRRALEVNQHGDTLRAIEQAQAQARDAAVLERLAADVPAALVDRVDPAVADTLREALENVYRHPPRPLRARPLHLTVITPTRELGYPMWRFRRRELADAIDLGGRDAAATVTSDGGGR